jgi:predicted phosphate transport protein (TIGR00153 family)
MTFIRDRRGSALVPIACREETFMPFSLVPKERQFFVLFREDAANLMEALKELDAVLNSEGDFGPGAKKLRDLEHQGDEITHRIIRELNSTFVTPFDREDIYALASTVDDVLDLVEEAADTIVIDRIERINPEAQEMGRILLEIGKELLAAFDNLDSRKNLEQHWVKVHDLENQGDTVIRRAIGALFENSDDPIYVIKWKDVYALLEKTIDRTEDVANILENVTIKNA